jgi:hypothetical protein
MSKIDDELDELFKEIEKPEEDESKMAFILKGRNGRERLMVRMDSDNDERQRTFMERMEYLRQYYRVSTFNESSPIQEEQQPIYDVHGDSESRSERMHRLIRENSVYGVIGLDSRRVGRTRDFADLIATEDIGAGRAVIVASHGKTSQMIEAIAHRMARMDENTPDSVLIVDTCTELMSMEIKNYAERLTKIEVQHAEPEKTSLAKRKGKGNSHLDGSSHGHYKAGKDGRYRHRGKLR